MGKKNKDKNKRYKGYRDDLAQGEMEFNGRIIYYNAVYNFIVKTKKEVLLNEIDRRIAKEKHYPSLEKTIKRFIIDKFFPEFNAPLSSKYIGEKMKELEYKLIPAICHRIFAEAKADADIPNTFLMTYIGYSMGLVAEFRFIRFENEIYHISDWRLCPDEMTQVMLRDFVGNQKVMLNHSKVVATGFLQLMKYCDKFSIEEFHALADWYLKDMHLEKSHDGAQIVLRELDRIIKLEDDVLSQFILDLYEEHAESFNQMMDRFPKYDFVRRGKSERYASISEFAKKHGETEDFFVEEANLGQSVSPYQAKRIASKEKQDEYKEKVFRDMETIFAEVQEYGTELHVLNFTPNEVKTKKPRSDYVAVAFKYNDLWYILVDSIKQGGSAIYLWKGERYSHGLDVFKMARTFAREEPGVTHKNHYHKIENIVKYRAIIQEAL